MCVCVCVHVYVVSRLCVCLCVRAYVCVCICVCTKAQLYNSAMIHYTANLFSLKMLQGYYPSDMDLEQCFRRAHEDIKTLLSKELLTSYNTEVVSVWSFNKFVHVRGAKQASQAGARSRYTANTTIVLALEYDDLYKLAASKCLLTFGKVCFATGIYVWLSKSANCPQHLIVHSNHQLCTGLICHSNCIANNAGAFLGREFSNVSWGLMQQSISKV